MIDYDNFKLGSAVGSLFRYYTDRGMYYREALNWQARWAQMQFVKRISKTVYEIAYHAAERGGKALIPGEFCTTCKSYACVCDA